MVANFLPAGYVPPAPTGGKFLNPSKITSPVTFRILSPSIMFGWSYWNTQNKPVRLQQQPEGQPLDARVGDDGKLDKVKHFWAMVVWNKTTDQIQVLEVTQASIQGQIQELAEDEAWGHPNRYDIRLTKEGERLTTKYTLIALPKFDPIPSHIAQEAAQVNLDVLWVGGDPFNASGGAPAPSLPPVPIANPPAAPAPVAQQPAAAKPAATPQQLRIAGFGKLTGHQRDQLRALAADAGLPSDSAQYGDAEASKLISAILLDWASVRGVDMAQAMQYAPQFAQDTSPVDQVFASWQTWVQEHQFNTDTGDIPF